MHRVPVRCPASATVLLFTQFINHVRTNMPRAGPIDNDFLKRVGCAVRAWAKHYVARKAQGGNHWECRELDQVQPHLMPSWTRIRYPPLTSDFGTMPTRAMMTHVANGGYDGGGSQLTPLSIVLHSL